MKLGKIVQGKKTTLMNTAKKIDFYLMLLNLLRSMDSLAHERYYLYCLSLFSGSFLKLGLGKRK